MHSNERLMPSASIRVNQAHSSGREGWKGGVGEGSHGSTGELQEQEKDKEDDGKWREASGNLALSSLCAASLRWGWEWCDLDSDNSGTSFLSHA